MSVADFLKDALRAVADSFDPLRGALTDLDSLRAFLQDFGWQLDPTLDAAHFSVVGQIFSVEIPLLNALPTADTDTLAVSIPALIASLLRNRTPDPTWPTPFNTAAFWSGAAPQLPFPRELLDGLLYDIAGDRIPVGFGILRVIGVFDEEVVAAVPATGSSPARLEYTSRAIDWNQLGPAISNPRGIFGSVYHWDDANQPFDHSKLLRNVAALFEGLPVGSSVVQTSQAAFSLFYDDVPTSPTPLEQLTILPLSYQTSSGPVFGDMKLTLNALPIPAEGTRTGPPVGLALFPLVSGQLQAAVTLADGITMTLSGAYTTIPVIAQIRPSGFTITVPPGAAGTITAGARLDAQAVTSPWLLFGSADSARLELSQLHLSLAAAGAITDPNFTIEFGLDKAAVVIDFGDSDSFLKSIFGGSPQRIELGFAAAWSSKTGFHVSGQAQLDMSIPIHFSLLGIIQIDTAYVTFRGDATGGFALDAAITGSFSLGPISAVVDRVGITTTLKPKNDGSGNLGMLDLGLGFKTPGGLGFSIDAGAVVGGGFIEFNNGEYAGFLDISIAEIIQVKFIAILDTKLPDGSKGYSLLFIIFMELPPIQLGFGFTLNGVGGIAGVHRTMSPSGLQTGIHNHTLDYLINPPHTIADAPKAITAINSFFPAAQGRYLFGPILELGWETFIEVTVGVILEVPDPIKLAILGILDIALPTIEEPEEALVKIHVDVLGIIDFGTKKLSIDGSMYDSSLLEFPLLGDFALRSSWGTNPSSAFSLGGFNPNFNATGLDMPQLHRLSITISDGDNPVISANAYLALTSNTRQFGANIEASVRAGSFSVHGYLGFDLLVTVQRHAISFEFDFAAILDVSYKGHSLAGINVTGQLTGPTPWHIHGDASFHILCFSVSKSVDHTWGQNILATIVAMAILPDLLPPFLDPQNWNAALPDGATQAVTLSAPAANKSAILVHPMGALTVREKVVPLDLTIDQYKNGTPADGNHFSMGDVLINGSKVSRGVHHQDYFAAGEFLNLTDADKLSRSSFELYHAGLHISSANLASGANASRTVEYQELYVEDPLLPPRPPVTYTMPADVFGVLSHQSAGFSSRVKNTGLSKYKAGPSTPAATTGDPAYVVASVDDLSVRTDIMGSGGTSYYQARDALNTHLAKNPQDAGKLQILPAHEVAP